MTYQQALDEFNMWSSKYKELDDDCFVLKRQLEILDSQMELVQDGAAAERLKQKRKELEDEMEKKKIERSLAEKQARDARRLADKRAASLWDVTKENEQKPETSVETMLREAIDARAEESNLEALTRAVLDGVRAVRRFAQTIAEKEPDSKPQRRL